MGPEFGPQRPKPIHFSRLPSIKYNAIDAPLKEESNAQSSFGFGCYLSNLAYFFHKTRLSCFAGADPTQPGAHPGRTYSRLSQTTVASGLSLRPSPALALCPHTNRHLVGCARSGDWPLDGDDSSSSQMQHQKTFGYRIYRRSPQPATRV